VIADNYVTDDSGTGVVHCAPAFGEDDHRVCLAAGIFEVGSIFFNSCISSLTDVPLRTRYSGLRELGRSVNQQSPFQINLGE
jgi:hypothetical protein